MNEVLVFLAAPTVMCLVLAVIHCYLGLHVLARGVIFVDLSLAPVASFGATLDVHGCERLFGPPPRIATRIIADLQAMGYTAQIGLATNPSLAAVASALAASRTAEAECLAAAGAEARARAAIARPRAATA